ncbi:MAG: ATP-binding protein [Anaerolineae bacterium]
MGWVRQDLEPDDPGFGKLVPCPHREGELAQKQLEDLRRASNLDHLADKTFDTFLPEGIGLPPRKKENLRRAYQLAEEYADQPAGWLVLTGGYGSGKTHLAAAVANLQLERGKSVLFVVVPDLLDHLRATFGPESAVRYDERFQALREAPILVLDDLGTESTTPWAQEKLYQLLNHRHVAQLPTVITTNRPLEKIEARLRSRMTEPGFSQIYHIEAPDFRGSGVGPWGDLDSLGLYRDKTFDRFHSRQGELPSEEVENLGRAVELARGYAEEPEGWLALTGEYGCGKTHLAAAIANRRKDLGAPALFIVVPDLLDHLRAAYDPKSTVSYDQLFEIVRHAPFLVLDDLGTQSATAWAREKLYQIFNHRYAARLPTVITMQESLEELERQEPRLASRLADVALSTVYAILAPSYRGEPRKTKG